MTMSRENRLWGTERIRRELVHVSVTANPTGPWVWRQLIKATPWGRKPRHLLRDHDAVYGRDFRRRARRIGIDAIATCSVAYPHASIGVAPSDRAASSTSAV